jgi:hypothetical protein
MRRMELRTIKTVLGFLERAIGVWMKTNSKRKKRHVTRQRKYL